jgi:hypothetical protein
MEMIPNTTDTSTLGPNLTPDKPDRHSTSVNVNPNLGLKSNTERIAQETELVMKNIQQAARKYCFINEEFMKLQVYMDDLKAKYDVDRHVTTEQTRRNNTKCANLERDIRNVDFFRSL